MKIALVNASGAPADAFPLLAAALAKYAGLVCDAWGLRAVDEVIYIPGARAAPTGYVPAVVTDTIDTPGALAYHTVGPDGGPAISSAWLLIPDGTLFRDPSGAGASLLDTLEHEVAELLIDPWANDYVPGPFIEPTTGHSHALLAKEGCDPVQETAGMMDVNGTACDVADFVLPAFFYDSVPGPFDHAEVLAKRRSLAGGGYLIVEDGTLADGQVFGRTLVKVYHPSAPAPWREVLKTRPGARGARRLAAGLPPIQLRR